MTENVGVCLLTHHDHRNVIPGSGSKFFAVSWADVGTNGNRRNSHESGLRVGRSLQERWKLVKFGGPTLGCCWRYYCQSWTAWRHPCPSWEWGSSEAKQVSTAMVSERWALCCWYSQEFRLFISNHLNRKQKGVCVPLVAILNGRL